MRAWIDRTNNGLSGMPADGINLPPKKGDFGTSRGAARRLGYINHATGRKGHDRLWPAQSGHPEMSAICPLMHSGAPLV
jgi:hypothetical protein